MSEPLRMTIVYEDASDGWVLARIPQVRGAISQGATGDEARENVIDALRSSSLRHTSSRARND